MFDPNKVIGDSDTQADFCETQIFSGNGAVCAETSLINQFFPDLDLDQSKAAYISAQNGWYNPEEGISPDFSGEVNGRIQYQQPYGYKCNCGEFGAGTSAMGMASLLGAIPISFEAKRLWQNCDTFFTSNLGLTIPSSSRQTM